MALLAVNDVTLRFGGIVALDGVSFDVEEGHIAGLIGPNGAGKTTAFNVITRLYKPDSGRVELDGKSILRSSPHTIVRKGIARTFQNIQLFRTMSVLENVLVGAHGRGRRTGAPEAYQVLDVVGLRDLAHFPAAALPYGTQKRVELARALVARPRLLLLDEPSLGLAPLIVRQIFDTIRDLNRNQGLTVFLVEQNAFHALQLANRGYVMVNGRITMTGPGRELLARDEIRAAYLEGGVH